jgi:hypothetical protein
VTRRAGGLWFWGSAAGALGIHALLLFGGEGLRGGADLQPHLRLIQLMGDAPALRTVYPPVYHVAGALLAPWVGLALFPKLFALASAGALIAGFRVFQRSTGLPDAASAIFAWAPYTFALSWCLPKVEAAGYALALTALGQLARRRHLALALLVLATFTVHTAAALFLGLCGGVMALARRDRRALAALAGGALAASPLFAAHLAAGCSLAQAFLFSQGDYLRTADRVGTLAQWKTLLALAGPVALAAALVGAPTLWRERRAVALTGGAVVALYLNELWLAPFGARSTLDLLRGLTILAVPVSAAAGVAVARRPRWAAGVIVACALWAGVTAARVVPNSCYTKRIDLAAIEALRVDRCAFRWRAPRRAAGGAGPGRGAAVPQSSALPSATR